MKIFLVFVVSIVLFFWFHLIRYSITYWRNTTPEQRAKDWEEIREEDPWP